MKTVKWHTQLGEEFKCRIHFATGVGHFVVASAPGVNTSARTKGVCTVRTECMPVTHGKAKVLFHGFASDYTVCVVGFEAHGIIRIGSFILNLANSGEILLIANK